MDDSQLKKTLKLNQSYLRDPSYIVLDESSTEEEEESFAEHSKRIKKGLVDGGVDSTATEFHHLIEFVYTIREKMVKEMQGATREYLKEQASREARVKNVPVNGLNVSYMWNTASTSGDTKKSVGRESNMNTK